MWIEVFLAKAQSPQTDHSSESTDNTFVACTIAQTETRQPAHQRLPMYGFQSSTRRFGVTYRACQVVDRLGWLICPSLFQSSLKLCPSISGHVSQTFVSLETDNCLSRPGMHLTWIDSEPDAGTLLQTLCPVFHSVRPTHFPYCMASCQARGQVGELAAGFVCRYRWPEFPI